MDFSTGMTDSRRMDPIPSRSNSDVGYRTITPRERKDTPGLVELVMDAQVAAPSAAATAAGPATPIGMVSV